MLKALLALVAAAMFAGGALYVSLAEHPARMRLDDRGALGQWGPSHRWATFLQGGLALLSTIFGLWAWWKIGVTWLLVGGLLTAAAILFTLVVILPTNTRLKAFAADSAGAESRALLTRWGRLHAVRTVLGLAAVTAYFAAFARPELL